MIDALESEVETLGRHFEILELVAANQPIGIVRLSEKTDYPKHKVRYSLRVLEEETLIEPTDGGAVTADGAAGALGTYRERLDDLGDRLRALTGDAEPVESA